MTEVGRLFQYGK